MSEASSPLSRSKHREKSRRKAEKKDTLLFFLLGGKLFRHQPFRASLASEVLGCFLYYFNFNVFYMLVLTRLITLECKCLLHLDFLSVEFCWAGSSSRVMMQTRPLGSIGTTRNGGFWVRARPEVWCWSRVPRMIWRWLSRISSSRADSLKYIISLKYSKYISRYAHIFILFKINIQIQLLPWICNWLWTGYKRPWVFVNCI